MRTRVQTTEGFTLVELMVVVLVIGVMVSIATPLYLRAADSAEARTCQSNQRNLQGCMALYESIIDGSTGASDGIFAPGGSSWYGILVPAWLSKAPVCPTDKAAYFATASGSVTGDMGDVQRFKDDHAVE